MTCRAQDFGKLIWADEFEGRAGTPPDRAKWMAEKGGGGWGNGELQVYIGDGANAFLDGQGHLIIRAVRNSDGTYTSARLKTEGKFAVRYCRVEARIKMPSGQGLWPAFWMLGTNRSEVGWPTCGEINIVENIGREPALIHGTVHGPGYSGGESITALTELPGGQPFSNGFHVFAVEWSAERIVFLLDGAEYARVTPASLPPGASWVFQQPFYLILDLSVGGGWPGPPDESTKFPQDMVVEYVRVSRL